MGGTESKQAALYTDSFPNYHNQHYQHHPQNSHADHTESSNNDHYYESNDEYDDECTNMIQSIPCFHFLFCPPNNQNAHQQHARRRRKKDYSYNQNNSRFGTPLPDTPNQMRQRRMAANGIGTSNNEELFYGNYGGLEVENSTRHLQHPNGNHDGGGHGMNVSQNNNSNGRNGNGRQQQYHFYPESAIAGNNTTTTSAMMQSHPEAQPQHYGQTLPKAIIHDGMVRY